MHKRNEDIKDIACVKYNTNNNNEFICESVKKYRVAAGRPAVKKFGTMKCFNITAQKRSLTVRFINTRKNIYAI